MLNLPSLDLIPLRSSSLHLRPESAELDSAEIKFAALVYLYLDKGSRGLSAGLEIRDLIIYYTSATLGMWGPST